MSRSDNSSSRRSSRRRLVTVLLVLLFGGLMFLLGSGSGEQMAETRTSLRRAWRRLAGPQEYQGYARQAPPAGEELTPRQRREIEALRSMAYLSGTEPASDAVGVTVHIGELAYSGLNVAIDAHGPEAVLMDMEGSIRHRWKYDFWRALPGSSVPRGSEGTQYWRRIALLDDGSLVAIFDGAGLIKIDRDSNLIWALDVAAHHDLEVQPDGSVLVLTRDAVLREAYDAEEPITEDWVVTLDAAGEIVRRVSVLDALERSDYRGLLDLTEGEGDLLHTNTVEVLDGRLADRLEAFAAGNVLLSFPKINTVAVLDMDREVIVWALAGLTVYQHDPTILDSGRMMIFDNSGDNGGDGRSFSRIIEIDPLSQRIGWVYSGSRFDFRTKCCGTHQRFGNGNTLITETDRGRAFEVTADSQIVWEYLTPNRIRRDGEELVARLFDVLRVDEVSVSGWLD